MGRKAAAKKERRENPEAAAEAAAAKAAPSGPIHVSDATFDRVVVESDVPVLVDFWAPWCGPCKSIAPVLDELSKELEGKVKIVKYNTEANQRVATAMNIRSIPTLVMFRDGQVADVKIGAAPRPALEAWVRRAAEPRKSLLSRLFG